jgi:hypothetical protein
VITPFQTLQVCTCFGGVMDPFARGEPPDRASTWGEIHDILFVASATLRNRAHLG